MCFFLVIFLCFINLMINKHTSYIIVLECWNTAFRKHPTVMQGGSNMTGTICV
jgi:hypothetical protein